MKETAQGGYGDILDLPRPVSAKRRRMTNLERAAQFSPFAALTGYDAAIAETARLTDAQAELGDWKRAELDEKLRLLEDHAGERPQLTVTYFQPDAQKAGGKYVKAAGTLKKLKRFEREILLTDGTVIPLDAVADMEGPVFDRLL